MGSELCPPPAQLNCTETLASKSLAVLHGKVSRQGSPYPAVSLLAACPPVKIQQRRACVLLGAAVAPVRPAEPREHALAIRLSLWCLLFVDLEPRS